MYGCLGVTGIIKVVLWVGTSEVVSLQALPSYI